MKPLNRSLLTLTLAGTLSALAGTAVAAPASSAAASDFKAYDTNADAKISLDEYQAQGGQEDTFRKSDRDGDNLLSRDEFSRSMNNSSERAKTGQFMDDAWITAKVKALLLKDEDVKGMDVNVETKHGTVQLSGSVENPAHIMQAEKIVRGVEGVKAVKNDLQVKG